MIDSIKEIARLVLRASPDLCFGSLLDRIESALHERLAADELEALHVIMPHGEPSGGLSTRRLAAALGRLLARGEVVRVAGSYYLTASGWARMGHPLGPREYEVLEDVGRGSARAEIVWRDTWIGLRCLGLVQHGVGLTPAGRAVLGFKLG